MEVEWIGVGAQVGSGYGSAVAAGDVDGDGLSELFVGVPLVSLKVASKGGLLGVSRGWAASLLYHDGVGRWAVVSILLRWRL